jgi:hypothetical protein
MNHLDYVDPDALVQGLGSRGRHFLAEVEQAIEREIDLIGLAPNTLVRPTVHSDRLQATHASFP